MPVTKPSARTPQRRPSLRRRALACLAASCCLGLAGAGDETPRFYSTARPPETYIGPVPGSVTPPVDRAVRPVASDPPAGSPTPSPLAQAAAAAPDLPLEPTPAPARPASAPTAPITRLASATSEIDGSRPDRGSLNLESRAQNEAAAAGTAAPASEEPSVAAQRLIASCRKQYAQIHDYSCTFYKRERVEGELLPYHVLEMKSRRQPFSIYFRFVRPYSGREAIYVHGDNQNQVVVHDVGINKVLAGTLWLDPRSRRAMNENRHPITDAGIGHLIDTVANRWALEMRPGETEVTITPDVKVGGRVCTLIESTHPKRAPGYMFRTAKVYIDRELNLPIRFEAFDWPRQAGQPPILMEEYTYANLRVNTGLSQHDFDPGNQAYSFGRF